MGDFHDCSPSWECLGGATGAVRKSEVVGDPTGGSITTGGLISFNMGCYSGFNVVLPQPEIYAVVCTMVLYGSPWFIDGFKMLFFKIV